MGEMQRSGIDHPPVMSWPELERRHVQSSRPVRLTDPEADRALTGCGVEELAARLRSHGSPISATYCSAGRSMPPEPTRKPLTEFLAELPEATRRGGSFYYAQKLTRSLLERVLPEVQPPPYFQDPALWGIWLFVGRRTLTPSHYHPYLQAVVHVLTGTKGVWLAPPSATGSLSPEPVHHRNYNLSTVQLGDLARRTSTDVQLYRCTLEAGDRLFIPVHWWHEIEGSGATVSLSFFWRAELRHMRFPTPGLRSVAGMVMREPAIVARWLMAVQHAPRRRRHV